VTNRLQDVTPSVSDTELEEIAHSRMERARIDILLEQPFLATALLSIPMRGTSEQSISKALVTDGRRIVYRHDLVAALDRPRVRRLVMHALMHALLKHPERGGARESGPWTLACDIAIDLLFKELGLEPGNDASVLAPFAGLSAEGIYDKVVSLPQGSRPRMAPADDAMLRSAGSSADHAEHEVFERTMSGTETPSPLQLEQLNRDLLEAVRAAAKRAPGCGAGAGSGSAEIDAAAGPQVSWSERLARFMRASNDRDWSFARPNRRHIWRGLYLPGPLPIDGGRFVVAIDTSGSMSDADLARILSEVDAIRTQCASELTVMQFDAEIHAVAEFSRFAEEDSAVGSTKVMRMYGRGGTDIRLPFEWAERELAKGREISALIVCTDGFGPLPDEAPRELPVLFLLTPNHRSPRFGERVPLGSPVASAHASGWLSEEDADFIAALGF
jgi:predicted metal-dependent peptidase